MAKITRIVCDVCGKDRNERNHWFLVQIDGETAQIEPLKSHNIEVVYPEYQWHICSLDCLKEKLRSYVESFIPQPEIERAMDAMKSPRKRPHE